MTTYRIPSEVHTDDYCYQFDFDALPWFEQTNDEGIVALCNCGWGGESAADSVARFCERHDPRLTVLFDYLARSRSNTIGFECYVDSDAALVWLREHRPALAATLQEEDSAES